jgi:hypothetical protein
MTVRIKLKVTEQVVDAGLAALVEFARTSGGKAPDPNTLDEEAMKQLRGSIRTVIQAGASEMYAGHIRKATTR